MMIGMVLVIPAPWVLVWYLNWLVPCIKVPGRPNLSFTGNAMTHRSLVFRGDRASSSP